MPIFTIYLVIFSLANIGTPLTANFIGELMSFVGAFNKNVVIGSLAVFSVLLSAAYQMRLTNRLTGGVKSASLDVTSDLTRRETFMMLFLLLPTIYLGICPDYINNICSASVHTLLFSL
jgi:NADH-ubiquinone oxidoreductase chain 4